MTSMRRAGDAWGGFAQHGRGRPRTLIAEWRPHPGRAEPGDDGTGMGTGVVGDDPADGGPMGLWTSPWIQILHCLNSDRGRK